MSAGSIQYTGRSRFRLSQFALVVTGTAAGFLFQSDRFHPHSAIHRFHHVIYGEGRNTNRSEGLHFNTRPGKNFHGRFNDHGIRWNAGQFDADRGEQKRMAKRDQLPGFLRGLNPGDAGHFQHIPLGEFLILNEGERGRGHADRGRGGGTAASFRLLADVDHAAGSAIVEMAEWIHGGIPMGLIVREPGFRSWLVDAGRTGSRALGVPLGGAADRAAFQLGNALLDNDPNAAALEVTLLGPTLRAEHPMSCVVFGAPFDLRKNGTVELAAGTTFTLETGDTLKIGGTPAGCRGYLCVAGGFDSPSKLGSRSAFGGIRAGEHLVCGESRIGGRSLGFTNLNHTGEPGASATGAIHLRAIPGNQADWFAGNTFWESDFTVAPASDRMGLRLQGPKIRKRDGEMASEPVAPGAVQVANDGLPIVLGVDGQTIGGYPKVAHVIAADLDFLGQLRAGDAVRFVRVSLQEAEALAEQRRKAIANLAMRLSISTFH